MLLGAIGFGAVEFLAPQPAHAQDDWSVQGGDERRQEIIRRYRQLLEKNPEEGLIFDKLITYVGKGKGLERLINSYEKKVEDKPENVAYRLILGHLLKENNEYEAGLQQYDAAVNIDAKNSTAWVSRGSVKMELQQEQEAAADFEEALSLETNRDKKEKILRKLADVAFSQRNWEQAEKYYDQLIELDPRSEYLRLEYAQVLVKYKRFEKALEQYDQLLKLAGRDTKKRATTLRDKGDVYERMGEGQEAIDTYRAAMKLMRKGHWLHNELRQRVVDVYRTEDRLDELVADYEKRWRSPNYDESMVLGKLYDELGDETNALEYFERAKRLNRRKPDPRMKIINLLQRRGEEKKVVKAYEELIRVAPGQHSYQFDLVQLYFRMGEQKKAERQLDKIARRFRRDPQVYLQLADTYMRFDMRNKAGKAYERLVRIDPRNESYILSLGEYYYRSSETDKAKKTWDRLLDSRLDASEAHALLGETLAEHGQMDSGISHYQKAVELAPDDLTIRRGLALTYARARRWQNAVDTWRHIMDLAEEPEQTAEARARIIGIYEQQGRLRAKVREYTEAFEADEPDVEAGFFLAEAHLRQKQYAEAEAVYQKLIDMDGTRDEGDLEAMEALIRIYDRTEEHKKAIAVLEKLAELRPKLSREYYHRIAELSLELYDDDKAVSYAMRAVEQNPDDSTARARLGDVYRQMQNYEAATQQYREAIDLDPRNYDNYLKLAELLTELEQYDEAEDHYRKIVKKARDESLILKAARRAIKLADADARLDEIEAEFSPLVFSPTAKPVHRKIMLELYDRMVSPLITELRYGVGEDRDKSEQRLETLSRRALPALTAALQSDDIGERSTAVKLLGELRAGPAAPALARLAVDEASSLRAMAMSAIARIGDERAASTLVRALDHDDPAVRDLAAWALGYTGGSKAVRALAGVIEDGENWSQRALAAISLGRIGGAKAERALIDAARANGSTSGSNELHEAVVWSLGRIQSQRAVDELRSALEEGTVELRSVAAWSLARVATDEALGVLLDAFWSDQPALREVAGRGLVHMAGRASGEETRQTEVNEAAHDVQFVDERGQQIQTHALVQSLRQASRAIDVTPAKGFLARHQQAIQTKVADRLDAESVAVKRRVLNDLADMVSESGFGILSPQGKEDHQALEDLLEAIHPELRELAASDETSLLRPSAQLLGALQDPADESRLRQLAAHERPDVRQAAVSALGQMQPTDELLDVVHSGLSDASFSVRAVAAMSLGQLVGPADQSAQAATEALLETLDDDYRAVREAAARGLVTLGSDAAIEGLGERLDGLSFPVKLVALRALAASSEPAAEAALAPFRDHADARIRRAASGVGLTRQ